MQRRRRHRGALSPNYQKGIAGERLQRRRWHRGALAPIYQMGIAAARAVDLPDLVLERRWPQTHYPVEVRWSRYSALVTQYLQYVCRVDFQPLPIQAQLK